MGRDSRSAAPATSCAPTRVNGQRAAQPLAQRLHVAPAAAAGDDEGGWRRWWWWCLGGWCLHGRAPAGCRRWPPCAHPCMQVRSKQHARSFDSRMCTGASHACACSAHVPCVLEPKPLFDMIGLASSPAGPARAAMPPQQRTAPRADECLHATLHVKVIRAASCCRAHSPTQACVLSPAGSARHCDAEPSCQASSAASLLQGW